MLPDEPDEAHSIGINVSLLFSLRRWIILRRLWATASGDGTISTRILEVRLTRPTAKTTLMGKTVLEAIANSTSTCLRFTCSENTVFSSYPSLPLAFFASRTFFLTLLNCFRTPVSNGRFHINWKKSGLFNKLIFMIISRIASHCRLLSYLCFNFAGRKDCG